ncbi:MAG: thiamine-phosphate kinase [Candidatus Binatia bacterium]|nr:thiamine-phosphate kinase [Candidatus Binatia bacterium]
MSSAVRSGVGEFAFLRRLLPSLPQGAKVVTGPGHDAARVRVDGKDWLLTVDSQVEGIHFRLPWISWSALGRRSFRVGASDIAAMGGLARFVLVDCGVPRYVALCDLRRLELALAREASQWGAFVVGGNLHRAEEFALVLAVIGEAPRQVVTRCGAMPGDLVVVTGTLGDAALCVRLLEAGKPCPPSLRNRWRLPPRRDRFARLLVARKLVSAMIDVSDGLVQDLQHICDASGVGARLEISSMPLSRAYRRVMGEDVSLALAGGEDYELLFTVPPHKMPEVERLSRREAVGVRVIGEVVPGRRVRFRTGGRQFRLERPGFDHFSP